MSLSNCALDRWCASAHPARWVGGGFGTGECTNTESAFCFPQNEATPTFGIPGPAVRFLRRLVEIDPEEYATLRSRLRA